MKISLIITTKNEAKNIGVLLDSIEAQTQAPDEVVVADANSSDGTQKILTQSKHSFPIRIVSLKSQDNRAVGRNRAILNTRYDHILITDSGCRLDSHWVETMKEAFSHPAIDVVAGISESKPKNTFEASQVPYVLVMRDRVDEHTFLPATRSMGIKKSVWKAMGGFDEQLRFGEDYAFARKLKARGFRIYVQKHAIVYWAPRKNLLQFAEMIRQHAFGDAFSRTWRGKVFLIFLRYGLGFMFFLLLLHIQLWFGMAFLFTSLILYALFSIRKNIRYVSKWQAYLYLPLLQITSDVMVMLGTVQGFFLKTEV